VPVYKTECSCFPSALSKLTHETDKEKPVTKVETKYETVYKDPVTQYK
jgi:hypothetical protein